jgi:hypothetical protein
MIAAIPEAQAIEAMPPSSFVILFSNAGYCRVPYTGVTVAGSFIFKYFFQICGCVLFERTALIDRGKGCSICFPNHSCMEKVCIKTHTLIPLSQ